MAHEAHNAHDALVQYRFNGEFVTAGDVIGFSEFLHVLAQSYPEAAASPLWQQMVAPMHEEAGRAVEMISRLVRGFDEGAGNA
jgi:hypothetical protein